MSLFMSELGSPCLLFYFIIGITGLGIDMGLQKSIYWETKIKTVQFSMKIDYIIK